MRSALALVASFTVLLALTAVAAYLAGWRPPRLARRPRVPDGLRRRIEGFRWRRRADGGAPAPRVHDGSPLYRPGGGAPARVAAGHAGSPVAAVDGRGVRAAPRGDGTRGDGTRGDGHRSDGTGGERAGSATLTADPGVAAPPLVRRLVVAGGRHGRELEPRLPGRVVVGCQWHDSFFHGWCGTGSVGRPAVRLTVRGATLRGATHAGNGTEGQDAMGAAWDDRRQALYLAVADGLGSLRGSGPLASAAISAALQLCVTRPADTPFGASGARMFGRIVDGLRRTYEQNGEPLDGACTLVVAEVVPRFDGANVTVHGIGDSEAWLLYGSDWHPLHHERRATDNATREIPGHVDPRSVEYEVSAGSVLMLGTDGFAGALDTTTSPLARGLAGYWRTAPQPLDFVNHVGFVDDYWSDDRTALAVWIGSGHADG
jgi:hypothetical protein